MNRLIPLIVLLISTSALAQPYLVVEWASNARIVLSDKSCMVQGLTGKAAALQFTNGKFVRGCWNFEGKANEKVRIDWDNPAKPKDYAILWSDIFNFVDE